MTDTPLPLSAEELATLQRDMDRGLFLPANIRPVVIKRLLATLDAERARAMDTVRLLATLAIEREAATRARSGLDAGLREALIEFWLERQAYSKHACGLKPEHLDRGVEMVRAALASSGEAAPVDGLDAAWAGAEAALPEGWRPIRIERLEHPYHAHDDRTDAEWVASTVIRIRTPDDEPVQAEGSTPAEALLRLAARLRETGS